MKTDLISTDVDVPEYAEQSVKKYRPTQIMNSRSVFFGINQLHGLVLGN
jgi:hypothetical protein